MKLSDREIDTVIVHCADTYANMDIDAKWIRDIHVQERNWSDIGYHFVVKRDGTLEPGRDINEPGAHAKGHNARSIGVCLVGGKPDFNFTQAQMRTLEGLIHLLRAIMPKIKVIGHRDVSSKACPGFDVKAYFGDLTNDSV